MFSGNARKAHLVFFKKAHIVLVTNAHVYMVDRKKKKIKKRNKLTDLLGVT